MNLDNLIIVDEGNKFLFALCPWHSETQGSLCINKVPHNGRPKGYYFCFGCGKFGTLSEDKVDSLCSKLTNYREDDVKSEYTSFDWNNWVGECEFNIQINYSWLHLSKGWNIKPSILSDLCCGWWHNSYTFPFRNENNEIIGIQLRYPNGKKRCVEGSKLGLFIPQGINWATKHTIFITEGVSDLACLLDLGFIGIARPSANSCKQMVYKWLKNTYPKKWPSINIISDNDEVGHNGAIDLRNCIDGDYKDVGIFIPKEAKDLRSWVEKKGKDFVRKELTNLL